MFTFELTDVRNRSLESKTKNDVKDEKETITSKV